MCLASSIFLPLFKKFLYTPMQNKYIWTLPGEKKKSWRIFSVRKTANLQVFFFPHPAYFSAVSDFSASSHYWCISFRCKELPILRQLHRAFSEPSEKARFLLIWSIDNNSFIINTKHLTTKQSASISHNIARQLLFFKGFFAANPKWDDLSGQNIAPGTK